MDFILDKIKEYDTIIIHRHIRPDGDCIGSQLGLKNIIKETFPDKDVYVVGDETREFSHLGKMDQIPDELYQSSLIFILDVANVERISDTRYRLGNEHIKIDHHPKLETIWDLEWVDSSFSSCCEMIVEFYQKHPELKLTKEGAKALYYGIVTDTNRFLAPGTNSRTLQLASSLIEYDIDVNNLYQAIYDETVNVTRLKGYVAFNFICTKNGLGYIKLNKKKCKKFLVDASVSNVLVNTLGHTINVKIWFVAIYDNKTNNIRISLRSKSLPINQIAEKYGGGGHKNASGIIIQNFKTVDKLIYDLDKYLGEVQ